MVGRSCTRVQGTKVQGQGLKGRTVFCNPQGLEPALLPLRQLRGLEVTVLPVRRSLDGRVVRALTVCQLRGLEVTVLTVRL